MNKIDQFARALKDSTEIKDKKKTSPYDTSAKVVRVDGNTAWVAIDGGVPQTPAIMVVNAKEGDNVRVRVGGGKAYVTGNATAPPTDDRYVLLVTKEAVDYIAELKDKDVTVRTLTAAAGYVDDLYANNITTKNIKAVDGYIQHLVAEDITAQSLVADHAAIETVDATYAKISSLSAVRARVDDLEANELIVNDTLKATNAEIEYLSSDWISTDRLVLTGNNKNNYPPVQITEEEFNANKTAYWTKSGSTYTQCTQQSVYDPDEQYYVRQTVKSIIEAINTANNTDPQIVVSNDKLIAASMDVAELSAITADMGTITAGKIQKGNNFINLNTSPASMEFKNASTWESATQGLQWDTQGNLNIKGAVTITPGSNVPTIEEMDAAITDNAVEYIVGTQSASTNAWTGVTESEAIYAGKTIAYYLPYAGTSTAATLNLTLPDGTTTGAIALRRNNSTVTTQFPQYSVITMTYDGTYWRITGMGSDTNYYDRTAYKASVTANAAISSARIGVFNTSGNLILLSTTAFDVTRPILYIGTAYTATALTQTNNYTFWGTAFNLTNTHTITGAAAGKPVYIVGTLSGTTFTPTSAVLTCTVPTSADGYVYLRLGLMSTATNAVLEADHPMYMYYDGKFQQCDPATANAATTATSYITKIDDAGIFVSPSNQSPTTSAAGNSVRIDGNGLKVYKGGTAIAQYGDTATIGAVANSKTRVVISNTNMQVISRNSSGTDTTLATIGSTITLRNALKITSAGMWVEHTYSDTDLYTRMGIQFPSETMDLAGKAFFAGTSETGTINMNANFFAQHDGRVKCADLYVTRPVVYKTAKNYVTIFAELDVNSAASSSTNATSGTDKDFFNSILALGWYSSVITS